MTGGPQDPSLDRPAADRVREQVARERHGHGLTDAQIGAVCHALADYSLLQAATRYEPDRPDDVAHSVGRFLHALGDQLDGMWDL